MMVLINSGSTQKILSEKIAKLLQLLMVPTKLFVVRITNKEQLLCQGRFDEVQVNLQDINFFTHPLFSTLSRI